MQAIYKATPVLLDISTALYYPTEWLTLFSQMSLLLALIISCQGTSLSRENGEKIESAEAEVSYLVGTSWCLMRICVCGKSSPWLAIVDNVSKHWWHQECKLLMLFLEIFGLYVSVFQYGMNIQVRNRLGCSLFSLRSIFLLNVLKFILVIYNSGRIHEVGLVLQVKSEVVKRAIAFDDDIEQDIGR